MSYLFVNWTGSYGLFYQFDFFIFLVFKGFFFHIDLILIALRFLFSKIYKFSTFSLMCYVAQVCQYYSLAVLFQLVKYMFLRKNNKLFLNRTPLKYSIEVANFNIIKIHYVHTDDMLICRSNRCAAGPDPIPDIKTLVHRLCIRQPQHPASPGPKTHTDTQQDCQSATESEPNVLSR